MKILASNRRARHEYRIESTIEAGLVLQGSEVKAIRLGRIQLREGWVDFQEGEAWLMDTHVGEYAPATHFRHEAVRPRKLLLHQNEIRKLQRRVREKGYTLIPLDVHLSPRGLIKLTIGLGKGKQTVDKRHDIKKRDQEREIARELRQRR